MYKTISLIYGEICQQLLRIYNFLSKHVYLLVKIILHILYQCFLLLTNLRKEALIGVY